jgi:hypothetical protein
VSKTRLNLATEVGGLAGLGTDELRRQWTELYGIAPAPRISRDVLIRGVAFRLQEEVYGASTSPVGGSFSDWPETCVKRDPFPHPRAKRSSQEPAHSGMEREGSRSHHRGRWLCVGRQASPLTVEDRSIYHWDAVVGSTLFRPRRRAAVPCPAGRQCHPKAVQNRGDGIGSGRWLRS